MHDVIIVGAGPAGSSAAIHCNKLGLKTLILEKSKLTILSALDLNDAAQKIVNAIK